MVNIRVLYLLGHASVFYIFDEMNFEEINFRKNNFVKMSFVQMKFEETSQNPALYLMCPSHAHTLPYV